MAPLSIATVAVVAVVAGVVPRGATVARAADAEGPAGRRCRGSSAVTFLVSPRDAAPGASVRVLAVSEAARAAVLTIEDGAGREVAHSDQRHGAAPLWWLVETTVPSGGAYRIRLVPAEAPAPAGERDDGACMVVRPHGDEPRAAAGGAWAIGREWDRGTELLFSVWIEHLFDDPLDAQPSWHGLDPILGDAARNLLYDYLGMREDSRGGMRLEPDCADLPFFLRAYFAWKLGLPFGYSDCSRGAGGAPRCARWHSSREPLAGAPSDEVERVGRFLRHEVGWTVQSGTARTAGNDDHTDLYPTRLAADTIRPGTVYADPYGHTLVVVQRLPQTAETGGVLLAVDAQPDGTIARKRYWRGNFLFADDPKLGGPGFKHFRPIVREGGALRPLTNREIGAAADYADFSLEQYAGDVDDFYDHMDDMLSPTPMDPAGVLRETIQALDEQVKTRITSVANGETYVASHPDTIAMPSGAAIFEANGAWEDYATPSRDLRLLIALDVVHGFPTRVARRPARYAMPAGTPAEAERRQLEDIIRDEAATRRFAYQRSDGSEQAFTLADVMQRAEALEIAYNPNDCIEIRWGAPSGSDEAATCRRHAPREQLARMAEYRVWFHERRRPARD